MKIQATKKEIMSLATNGKVYQQALALVGQGRVQAIHYNESERILRAFVLDQDSQKQKVTLLLRPNGYLQKSGCSCKDSRSFYGLCEHKTALILNVMDKDLKEYATLKANKLQMEAIEESLRRSTHRILSDFFDRITASHPQVQALISDGKSEEEAILMVQLEKVSSLNYSEKKELLLALESSNQKINPLLLKVLTTKAEKQKSKETQTEEEASLPKSNFTLGNDWQKDNPYAEEDASFDKQALPAEQSAENKTTILGTDGKNEQGTAKEELDTYYSSSFNHAIDNAEEGSLLYSLKKQNLTPEELKFFLKKEAFYNTLFENKDNFLSGFYASHWLTPHPHKSSYLASASTEWTLKEDFSLAVNIYLFKNKDSLIENPCLDPLNSTSSHPTISDLHSSTLHLGLALNFIYKEKSYPVTDWLKLRRALKSGQIYEVHKQFHFHPFHHKTTIPCAALLSWLSKISICEQCEDRSILLLQETQIKSFLKLLSQHPELERNFLFEGKQKLLPFNYKNTWPKLQYKVKYLNHSLFPEIYIVYLATAQKLYNIYEGGQYYWQGDTLYKIPSSSAPLLQSIKFLLKQPNTALFLDKSGFNLFASLFLQDAPHLLLDKIELSDEEKQKLLIKEEKIKKSLKEALTQADFLNFTTEKFLLLEDLVLSKQHLSKNPLNAHIHLDLTNMGLILTLKYSYGDEMTIYPSPKLIHANLQQKRLKHLGGFAKSAGLETERIVFSPTKQSDDKHTIYIREFAKEISFLHLLRQANFLPYEPEQPEKTNDEPYISQFSLFQAKEIYFFIKNTLPVLREKANVTCSESFNRLRIRPLILAPLYINYDKEKGSLLVYLPFPQYANFVNYESLLQISKQNISQSPFYTVKSKGIFDLQTEQSLASMRIFKFLHDETSIILESPLTYEKLPLSCQAVYEKFLNKHPQNIPAICFKLPSFRFHDLYRLLDQGNNCDYCLSEEAKEYKTLFENPELYFETNKDKFSLQEKWQGILRPYQQKGVFWYQLLSLFYMGGILADDMGLGKTLQTLVFIESLLKNNSDPVLVVVPTALSYNWQAEVQKFVPSIPCILIEGLAVVRHNMLEKWGKEKAILIASYGVVRKDISHFEKYHFSAVFLDEAQVIKNPQSMLSRFVKKLPSKYRFALSGTPIENNLNELWSIFDFLMPGYLHSQKLFHKTYVLPTQSDPQHFLLQELKSKIQPFILRRYKKDVLEDLPPKLEAVISCRMSPSQMQVYANQLKNTVNLLKKKEELTPAEYGQYQIQILAQLTRLRQICCHPALVTEDDNSTSGKLDTLIFLLEEALTSGHRCLIFSSFTRALKLIARELDKNSLLAKYFYLDGQTNAKDRQEMVDRFNAGENDLFLISLKAGGTGLNLTGADTVILFDPWWNPSVENQAMDRVHRFGQDKTVQVYRLIMKNSIENHMLNLQEKKKNLIQGVIEDVSKNSESLSIDQLNDLIYDALRSFTNGSNGTDTLISDSNIVDYNEAEDDDYNFKDDDF